MQIISDPSEPRHPVNYTSFILSQSSHFIFTVSIILSIATTNSARGTAHPKRENGPQAVLSSATRNRTWLARFGNLFHNFDNSNWLENGTKRRNRLGRGAQPDMMLPLVEPQDVAPRQPDPAPHDFSPGKAHLPLTLSRRTRPAGGTSTAVLPNFLFRYTSEIRRRDEHGNGICSESRAGSCRITMPRRFGNGQTLELPALLPELRRGVAPDIEEKL